MRKGKAKGILLTALGLLCSVLPPLLATVEYFPLWMKEGGGTALSGISLLLVLLCCLPLKRWLRRLLKTPSAPLFWFLLWAMLTLFQNLLDGLLTIAFWGFLGNTVGFVFFLLAKARRDKE